MIIHYVQGPPQPPATIKYLSIRIVPARKEPLTIEEMQKFVEDAPSSGVPTIEVMKDGILEDVLIPEEYIIHLK